MESSTTESQTNIFHLNDDCFDKIFNYLSYQDVVSASQVCLRLEDRSQSAFKRKKYTFAVYCDQGVAAKPLIRHIGPYVSKLELYFCDNVAKNQETIDMVTKHCIDNLTEIKLQCFSKSNKLRMPFSQVQTLILSFCDSIGKFKLTKWFPNLTSLTYHYTETFTKENVPAMHTLSINGNISPAETVAMLRSNPQIKNLSLNFVAQGFVRLQQNLYTDIENALPELLTLTLIAHRGYDYTIPYRPLHFKHLKTLRIENYINYPNYGLINHLAVSPESLERLELRLSDATGDSHCYKCITKYKKLRELKIMPVRHSLGVDDILMLANELPLLERIEQFADFIKILPWTDADVENFIRNSKQLMELSFVFVYENVKFNKSFNFFVSQCIASKLGLRSEERHGTKIFDTDGIDGQYQKQFVITMTKNVS